MFDIHREDRQNKYIFLALSRTILGSPDHHKEIIEYVVNYKNN